MKNISIVKCYPQKRACKSTSLKKKSHILFLLEWAYYVGRECDTELVLQIRVYPVVGLCEGTTPHTQA
jgi:hypothetical protein